MMKELPERFWAKVNKSDTCWLWTGTKSARGYGRFSYEGFVWFAHRLSYTAHIGPIPDGLVIDHKCRVPLCVRPDHLQAVTNQLNMQNRSGAMRNSKSGVRGVYRQGNKWRVQAKGVDGRIRSGGLFDDLEHAAIAAHNLRMDLMTNNLADDANADE